MNEQAHSAKIPKTYNSESLLGEAADELTAQLQLA